MRVLSYCLLIFILGTGCRSIRSLLLDKKTDPGITFVIKGDYQTLSAVRLVFDSQRITDRPLKPLSGKIYLTTGEQVCNKAITLNRHNEIEELACRARSVNDELRDSFADKLYFFPYGNHCQLGRLADTNQQEYQVEFCGQVITGDKFNLCVKCQNCEAKTTTINRGDFDLQQATYPFNIFAGVQRSYRVETKTDEKSAWRGRTVTFNGNGVLFVADRESCLFGDGCQIRIAKDPANKCSTPKPLN